MFYDKTLCADAALVASVPVSALSRTRVRRSAKRLLSYLSSPQVRMALPGSERNGVRDLRTLCGSLLSKGTLEESEACALQRRALEFHDSLTQHDSRADIL
ncbi:hypothetical protein ATO8_06106 [Roseivivax marinus]|jgi:hypothetical protein|uniref:Uncharacterized protein n=1 Tax=Roseivivax marinus TaxID=1379903 RepID=W4HNK0_9RHOB|nr:hypothetical protein [Roseivivax marinus]ETW13580.1 hypothetical protein ATO8_06106 [Roseivivax marinus]UMA65160.1 hypothetical protein LVO79_01400 [Roseivivax marinus]SEK55703.1 hypothetical protein SAMN05444413_102193 [Roseivivax marinus]